MDSEAYIFEVINGQSLLVKDNFGNYYQVSTNTNSYNFEVKKNQPTEEMKGYFHQLDSSVVKLKLLYPYTDHFWYFKVDLHNSMYQTIDKNPYYNQNWEISFVNQ